ncbi:transposase [Gloeobacter kilaueensis]|uniref:Transposase IS4 family protein n=1 Tax=Gloeobacter kilaueensis (strain ATCC BAA-2537 / CCAP 1431/1 / ULC 316 / JS1) TaxID=1183438 RepID=U5QLB6_GLOK1|nr:transposase [Gloeobacter kilaueensis]AGY59726.1 transposase IS4 family protein [Gloeobacter kilaueensis JS1]
MELPRQFGVELIGPVLPDTSWQTQAGKGFESFRFQIDWQAKQVRCPMGRTSNYWSEGIDRVGEPLIRARFSRKDCEVCPGFQDCTTSAKYGRCVSFRPQEQHEALQRARAYQATQEFKERYQCRAGIEGSISEAVRVFGMRRSRYIGVAKTHLQHMAIAAAINLHRWFAWVEERPMAATRVSRFQALAPLGS